MNVNMLKDHMRKMNITQKEMADFLGMSQSSFRRKLSNDGFGIVDANLMIELLHIEDPEFIFFSF